MPTPFGRYTLIRKLATGGMAEVFLARADGPMGFQKKCVVKRILPHFTDDPAFVEMFLGEARLAAELNHPNLVQIFDFGEVDGQYFIAMEYIDGPNLRLLNRAVRGQQGPMALPLAARIVSLATEGLHFAHELKDASGRPLELVHRDISPDNILVSRTGGVKVVDFGIAKAANQPHLTRSGMVKGKLAYMPPEQLAREPLDRRADIFALGIVLFELVSGEMPFDATSEVSIIQAIMGQEPMRRLISRRLDVPADFDAIVAKCLEKDRSRRYPSCRELQSDLERFIQSSGQVVGVSDVAALVEQWFPPEHETGGHVAPTDAPADPDAPFEPTLPTVKSAGRNGTPAQARHSSASAATAPAGSRAVSKSTARAPQRPEPTSDDEFVEPPVQAPRRSGIVGVVAGVLLLVIVGGAVAYGVVTSRATTAFDAGVVVVPPHLRLR